MADFKGRMDTRKKKALFLRHYANLCIVKAAAEATKISPPTVYQWRQTDTKFREEMDGLKPVIGQSLLDEAVRRGRDGVKKPVYQGGKRVGAIREYSDTLLSKLLDGMLPDMFGKKRVDHKIVNKNALEDLTNEQLVALYQEMEE